MANDKHTPGPWTCHCGMVYKDGPSVYPKGDEWGIPIARMDREPGNGTFPVERDANARLIAAAPDLLKELRGLAVYLQHLESCVPKAGVTEQLNSCLKAIAKAEGKN